MVDLEQQFISYTQLYPPLLSKLPFRYLQVVFLFIIPYFYGIHFFHIMFIIHLYSIYACFETTFVLEANFLSSFMKILIEPSTNLLSNLIRSIRNLFQTQVRFSILSKMIFCCKMKFHFSLLFHFRNSDQLIAMSQYIVF